MVANRLPRPAEAWVRVAAATVAMVLLIVAVAIGGSLYAGNLVLLFIGVLAQVSALPLALIRPYAAAPLAITGAVLVMLAAHAPGAPWPWAVTTMITHTLVLLALGHRAPWMLGAASLVVAVAASGLVAAFSTPAHDQDAVAVNLIVTSSLGAAALIAGVVMREWSAIREQLARERRVSDDERTRRLLAEEKTRIARELHDVVAHSMSLITVQATSAPYRHAHVDAEVRREFDDIAASSRRALAEMRSLLAVLRDPESAVPRSPQPRLSSIVDLVAQSQHSGLGVELRGAETLTDEGVDDAVGLTAYRVVQEALSNVIRHARGAAVTVQARRGERLELAVTNSAPPPGHDEADQEPGSGLLGMRERAASVGGSLAFGTTRDGGYEVRVMLPLRVDEDAATRARAES